MKPRYLTESELSGMASAACASYEFACDWRAAGEAAAEYAADELGARATSAQVATAVRLAQTQWEGYRMEARHAST